MFRACYSLLARPLPVLAALWLGVVSGGFFIIQSYENTPGQSGEAPATWPSASDLEPPTNQPLLVMFAHPRCPCTAASIRELADVLQRCRGKVQARIVFYEPQGGGSEWHEADNPRTARDLPGLTTSFDIDGQEAKRFGVKTSGHVLVYGTDRQLKFSGGITVARGQTGTSDGSNALVALLTNARGDRTPILPAKADSVPATCVFGCPVLSDDSKP